MAEKLQRLSALREELNAHVTHAQRQADEIAAERAKLEVEAQRTRNRTAQHLKELKKATKNDARKSAGSERVITATMPFASEGTGQKRIKHTQPREIMVEVPRRASYEEHFKETQKIFAEKKNLALNRLQVERENRAKQTLAKAQMQQNRLSKQLMNAQHLLESKMRGNVFQV